MQIEQLASMSTEARPQTTTTVFDVAAATPRIWNFRSWVRAKWRSKGALVFYAVLGLSLLGGKWYLSGPRHAAAAASTPTTPANNNATRDGDETRKLIARLQASKAKNAAGAKVAPAKAAQQMASTPASSASTNTNASAPVVRATAGNAATATAVTVTAANTGGSATTRPSSTSSSSMARSDGPTKAGVVAAPTTAPTATAAAKLKAPADALGALYIDETNGYSVRFPAGWTIHTFDGDPWVCDVGDGKIALISIGFSPFPDNITAENIPPDWIAKKIKRRADTTLHAQGYSMISGRKALWSKSTGPLPMTHATPRMTRVNYILPLGDGRVLELRVAAAPEVFDRLVPVMRKSVETFALQTPRKRDTAPVASAR